jgi:hypothetical protein
VTPSSGSSRDTVGIYAPLSKPLNWSHLSGTYLISMQVVKPLAQGCPQRDAGAGCW